MGQLSTVDRAFRRLKPRARSADRFSATVERRGASRPYLPRDVVDGQVEVGAEHLEGEALGLASAAFLRGRGRMMSVPALESGRVALAEDVARDAARGRRTAGNISREGRGFLAAFPKKRTGWTRRARAETTGSSAIRGARARRSPHANAKSPETALVHPSRSPRHPRGAARVPWASSPNSCGCSVRDRNRFHRAGSFRLSRLGAPARARATEWGRPRRDRECDHASRSRAPIERRGFWPARDAEGNDLTAHVAALFVTFQPSGSDSASRGSRRVCAFSHTTRAFWFLSVRGFGLQC